MKTIKAIWSATKNAIKRLLSGLKAESEQHARERMLRDAHERVREREKNRRNPAPLDQDDTVTRCPECDRPIASGEVCGYCFGFPLDQDDTAEIKGLFGRGMRAIGGMSRL